MKAIYLGPSGYEVPQDMLEGWTIYPPCKQSDIFRLIDEQNPSTICIVDGLYKSIPAPWHKEILLALERGIEIHGLGSLGALRAAELDQFGMKGYGYVYNFIKEHEYLDDSIVALLHQSEPENYKPITLAKIEIVYLFQCHSNLDKEEKHDALNSILGEINHTNFEQCSYKYAIKMLSCYDRKVNWNRILKHQFVSIKQQDVINYLQLKKGDDNHKINSTRSVKEKIQKTPYIYRQRSMDYESGLTVDISDLNYSLQLYASISKPMEYDMACMKAHLILVARSANRLIKETDKNKYLGQYLENFINRSILTNKNLLEYIKTDYTKDLIKFIKEMFIEDYLYSISNNDFSLYMNFYGRSLIYGSQAMLTSEEYFEFLEIFRSLVILSRFVGNKKQVGNNKDYKEVVFNRILEDHNHMLSIIRSHALQYYHCGLSVQNELSMASSLIDEYISFIDKYNTGIPYALYGDNIDSFKRKGVLRQIKELNSKRFLPIQPSQCGGTHFFFFNHLIVIAEKYYG